MNTDHNVDITTHPTRGRCLHAARSFRTGELVVRGTCESDQETPGIWTVQVERNRHVTMPEPARLLSHSCEPCLGVQENNVGVYDFIALRPIAAGEELSFDYETTEWHSMGFTCSCSTPSCRGALTGFGSRSQMIMKKYGHYVAKHLTERELSIK